MSLHPEPVLDEATDEAQLFSVLGVLPSAPKELMVEVYWHLAGRVLTSAQRPPNADRELRRLNDAYATIMHADRSAQAEAVAEPHPAAGDGLAGDEAPSLWPRIWRRDHPAASPRSDPWRVLHLQPGASADVVDLAYDIG